MSHRSRVLSHLDMMSLSTAVARPGIDPRTWVSLAIVTSDPYVETYEGEQDVFVDIMLMPSKEEETARVGSMYAGNGFGCYFPLKNQDEVLVCAPNGDPDEGLVVMQRLWSPSDPPPAIAASNPQDPAIVVEPERTLRIGASGTDGKVVVTTEADSSLLLGTEDSTKTGYVLRDIASTQALAFTTALGIYSGYLKAFVDAVQKYTTDPTNPTFIAAVATAQLAFDTGYDQLDKSLSTVASQKVRSQ